MYTLIHTHTHTRQQYINIYNYTRQIHTHTSIHTHTHKQYERSVLRDPPNSHQTHWIILNHVKSGAGDCRSRGGFSGETTG